MFLKNSTFMYQVHSLKTYRPIRFSYGFARAGKTAYEASEKMFKKYAHSVQPYGP